MARSVEAIRVSERVKLREMDIGRCRERERGERGKEEMKRWSLPGRSRHDHCKYMYFLKGITLNKKSRSSILFLSLYTICVCLAHRVCAYIKRKRKTAREHLLNTTVLH